MLKFLAILRMRNYILLCFMISALTLLPGSASAESTTFFLPWTEGDSWMVSQAYDGITHQANAYYGIDFWKPGVDGLPVLASADGVVVKVVNSFTASTWPNKPTLSGNVVILRHDDGTYTQYCHLQKEIGPATGTNGFVKVGDRIKRGTRIGSVGTTGSASGAHLHFQRQNGDSENSQSIPLNFADVAGGQVAGYKWYTPSSPKNVAPASSSTQPVTKPTPSTLTATPPAAGTLVAPKNGDLLPNQSILFQWTEATDYVGITDYTLKVGKTADLMGNTADLIVNFSSGSSDNPLQTSYSVTVSETTGNFYWTIVARNKAGLAVTYDKGMFSLDAAQPTGSISLAEQTQLPVEAQSVELVVQASDAGSGVSEMILSEDPGFGGASWEPFSESKDWVLSDGEGDKYIYAQFMDRAGNISSLSGTEVQVQADQTEESSSHLDPGLPETLLGWLLARNDVSVNMTPPKLPDLTRFPWSS